MSHRHRFPQPFIKWAGGKSQVLGEISRILPRKFNGYHEPFLGGGALFFHLRPQAAFVSDSNFDLINAYCVVRDDIEPLLAELKRLQKKLLSRSLFDQLRKLDPSALTPPERAARFIFLNKTCYNGLYRVNKGGIFNVPIGRYKKMPTLFDEQNLREVASLLTQTRVQCADYMTALTNAASGDLVYLDPPYSKDSDQAFVSYTKESFSENDQRKLAAAFRELDHRGCLLILSNSDTTAVRRLYSDYANRTKRITAGRWINSVGSDRTGYSELLITNYIPQLETLAPWVVDN